MASYNDLETYIKNSTDMEDSKLVALINPAINMGIWLATILFEPASQLKIGDQTAISTARFTTISLTRWLRIDHIYNSTGGNTVWPTSFPLIDNLWIDDSNVSLFAVYGTRLYYKPIPSSSQTLSVHYLQYPARITSGQSLPFSEHDDFILNTAMRFIWATQEEAENVDMWTRVGADLGIGTAVMRKLKDVVQREKLDVNNLQRTISESADASK